MLTLTAPLAHSHLFCKTWSTMRVLQLAVGIVAALASGVAAHPGPFNFLSLLDFNQGQSNTSSSPTTPASGTSCSGTSTGLVFSGPPANLSQVNSSSSLNDALASNSSFTIFSKVLQLANLTQELNATGSGGGQVTVFAPIDAAFASLPAWVRAAFEQDRQETIDLVRAIALYHIVDRQVTPSQFTSSGGGGGGGAPAASVSSSTSTASPASAYQPLYRRQEGTTTTSGSETTAATSSPSSSASPSTSAGPGSAACTQQEQQQQRQHIMQRLQSVQLQSLNKVPTRLANLSLFLGQGGGTQMQHQQQQGQQQQQQQQQGQQQQQMTYEVNLAQVVSVGNASGGAVVYGINQVLTPLFYLKQSIYEMQAPPNSTANTTSSSSPSSESSSTSLPSPSSTST
ncbi:hypothetical protein HK405_014609 [Cladochytrium tenue]|nr:hypothetical protein HK405_014609 [Cladochytrium tenue]